MKFMMEIDPDLNPDAVGEYLRSAFFDEKVRQERAAAGHRSFRKMEIREVGCYSTFEWRKDVEPLPQLPISEEHNHPENEEAEDLCWACASEGEMWTRGRKKIQGNTIECRYFWDGDGTLAFQLPNGKWLVNNDCKKDHGWEIYPSLNLNDY